MAKKATAAKKAARKAPRKTAAKKAAGKKGSDEATETPDDLYDWSTARPAPDHQVNQNKAIVTFLVDDKEGNEVLYATLRRELHPDAKKALEIE